MSWHRKSAAVAALASLLAALALLAQPAPERAQANPLCAAAGVISGGVGAISGAIGLGNPASDACNAVTDEVAGAVTKPVTDALKGIGNGILEQVTTWVAQGASWLMEQVVEGIEKTTTPDLTTSGFLTEYVRMAEIAALLATVMVLLALVEAVVQNSWAIVGRALLIGLPVAFLGTTVAFAIVQMLIVATDQMSHGIAVATHHHSEHFFKNAIGDLADAGASAGGTASDVSGAGSKPAGEAAGGVAVPLFVTFLTAIVGAFAAFFVWIELIMRDAAVYVVALFMPLSFAAYISPRWAVLLKRTIELLVVVIGSKFVIVSIIALAAGLMSEKGASVEHIIAASALLLIACFAPFMFLKMVLSLEGAMSAAYSRRSASGGAVSGVQLLSEAHMVRSMARSNWGEKGAEVWSVKGEGGSSGGGGSPGGRPGGGGAGGGGGGKPGGGAGKGGGGAGGGSEGGAGAGAPEVAGASAPLTAAKGARSGAGQLAETGVAQIASGEGTSAKQSAGSGDAPARPSANRPGGASSGAAPPGPTPERPQRPAPNTAAKPSPKGA
jgi:hypothetical protein